MAARSRVLTTWRHQGKNHTELQMVRANPAHHIHFDLSVHQKGPSEDRCSSELLIQYYYTVGCNALPREPISTPNTLMASTRRFHRRLGGDVGNMLPMSKHREAERSCRQARIFRSRHMFAIPKTNIMRFTTQNSSQYSPSQHPLTLSPPPEFLSSSRLLMTTTPPSGSRTASSKEVRRADGLVCKKRTTPPVKGGDNINAPVPRRPIPAFRGRSGQRDGSADSNAAAELMPPPLSKDRTSSSLPPFDGRRSRIPSSISANNNSGSSSEGCCFWPRSTRAARLSPIRRLPRKEPATVMGEAVPDLACYEVLDMDAVMLSGGEVRRPICRYLLPCWPEGVEGYEEVGGWRRLGVATTPDSSQEGRRRA